MLCVVVTCIYIYKYMFGVLTLNLFALCPCHCDRDLHVMVCHCIVCVRLPKGAQHEPTGGAQTWHGMAWHGMRWDNMTKHKAPIELRKITKIIFKIETKWQRKHMDICFAFCFSKFVLSIVLGFTGKPIVVNWWTCSFVSHKVVSRYDHVMSWNSMDIAAQSWCDGAAPSQTVLMPAAIALQHAHVNAKQCMTISQKIQIKFH